MPRNTGEIHISISPYLGKQGKTCAGRQVDTAARFQTKFVDFWLIVQGDVLRSRAAKNELSQKLSMIIQN